MMNEFTKDLMLSMIKLQLPKDFIIMVAQVLERGETLEVVRYVENNKPTTQEIIRMLNQMKLLPEGTVWRSDDLNEYGPY